MGKASRWFRGLLGLKTTADSKKKWSFTRSRKDQDHRNDVLAAPGGYDGDEEAGKHAIAVAAATAAVAEAAVAAAQAAAAVVQLTGSGRNICVAGYRSRENRAAVTIQSHFRGYLSRRALRALKALVRLQALVRGHLVRKETAYILRSLQALARAQARARAGRVFIPESPYSSMKLTDFNYQGPATPEKFEHVGRSRSMKQALSLLKRTASRSSRSTNNDPEKIYTGGTCSDSRIGERAWEQRSFTRPHTTDDGQSVKVLEVDSGKPHPASRGSRRVVHSTHVHEENICHGFSRSKDSTEHQSGLSLYGEAESLSHPKNCTQYVDESAYCTADNSPTFYSASSMGSSKRGAFTHTSSDCSRSCVSGYSDNPNYMAYTESSKAKVRSLSAPKLRPQFERSSSTKKYSHQTYGDLRSSQRGSLLHFNFTSKAYPGSGRLNRLGIPA